MLRAEPGGASKPGRRPVWASYSPSSFYRVLWPEANCSPTWNPYKTNVVMGLAMSWTELPRMHTTGRGGGPVPDWNLFWMEKLLFEEFSSAVSCVLSPVVSVPLTLQESTPVVTTLRHTVEFCLGEQCVLFFFKEGTNIWLKTLHTVLLSCLLYLMCDNYRFLLNFKGPIVPLLSFLIRNYVGKLLSSYFRIWLGETKYVLIRVLPNLYKMVSHCPLLAWLPDPSDEWVQLLLRAMHSHSGLLHSEDISGSCSCLWAMNFSTWEWDG